MPYLGLPPALPRPHTYVSSTTPCHRRWWRSSTGSDLPPPPHADTLLEASCSSILLHPAIIFANPSKTITVVVIATTELPNTPTPYQNLSIPASYAIRVAREHDRAKRRSSIQIHAISKNTHRCHRRGGLEKPIFAGTWL